MKTYTERCPNCGRFVSDYEKGYLDYDELSYVVKYCNERCARMKRIKDLKRRRRVS